jgi:hypothetical protein
MRRFAIVLVLAGTGACSLFDSFVSGAATGASDQAGRNVGAAMVGSSGSAGARPASYGGGSMSMATMNPAFLNMYMGFIFTYAFSSGGYDVSQVPYKPGEYTRWSGKGHNGKAIGIERAHLFDDAQGRQWWKVKFTDDEQKTTILEGLLDPAQKKFVRMRAKFPDDKEGKEMPMDDSSYYHPPQHLTKESVEGATKGIESVSVPAGTFKARHVVFANVGGTSEWWLADKVPGGAVKQLVKGAKSEEDRWEMELQAYGSGAQSELGSK